MRSTQRNDASSTRLAAANESGKCYDTGEMKENVRKVGTKNASSSTGLLAGNTPVLSNAVVKSKCDERVKAKIETMPSSGSATGKNCAITTDPLNRKIAGTFIQSGD